jgi:N-acetylmuramoyl-L-alanine amidase
MFSFKSLLLFVLYFATTFVAKANLEEDHWIFHFEGKEFKFKRHDIQRGSPRIDLAEISKTFPVVMGMNPKTKVFSFAHKKEQRVAMFKIGDQEVKSTWGKIIISEPPLKHDDKILVPIDFGERVVVPLLTGKKPQLPDFDNVPSPVDIVIDAGHGGNDWGARFKSGKYLIKEKDVILILAVRLKEVLEKKGHRVHLTRDGDYFLSLPERSDIANHAKAKFFLSLHFNSHGLETNKVRGFETYVLSMSEDQNEAAVAIAKEQQIIPTSSLSSVEKTLGRLRAEANLEQSVSWAKPIADVLDDFLPRFGKPIKMGPFYVLYGANMPAVLLEMGFINNPDDMSWFHDFKKQKKLITALANALSERLKKEQKPKSPNNKEPKNETKQ